MASFPTLTYDTLASSVYSAIKSLCTNVDRLDIDESMKTGYAGTEYATGTIGTSGHCSAYIKYTIQNPISQVSSSDLNTAFYNLLSAKGITLSAQVTADGLLCFMNAVSSFCSATIRVASSIRTTNKYLIYIASSSYPSVIAFRSTDTAYADRMNEILTLLNSYVISSARPYNVIYTLSYGNSY